ncbi:FIST signal transduction protein [Ramlibacter sp. PS4R-6]|uniref:FIST signal transduction protein n=1 Tax=Ramlibacter sp. PS4R-6 TaxID=3133438 RepID=UPI0030B5C384
MTQTHIAFSQTVDSARAGAELGRSIRGAFAGAPAHAVVVFASAVHDYPKLLEALAEHAGTRVIAGASSAGEFTDKDRGEGRVSALAIRSPEMKFSVGLGQGVGTDPADAARQTVEAFAGIQDAGYAYRNALVMTDALAGHADALVEQLTVRTGGNYRFFGGGAGDDGRFQTTHVFVGTRAYTNAVAALEILSRKPVGIGVAHGWEPAGEGLRVTEARGAQLVSLNGAPAVEAFEAHARQSGQKFDRKDPLPFFLHNVIGIRGDGPHRLRVPLAVAADGSVMCAANVPEGTIVHFMKTSNASAVQAARHATQAAIDALAGETPAAALVFDCVATRLRMGREFEDELQACANLLAPAGFVGCNTYGQIARAEGQFSGFHNCTAVVCVLPS